MTRDWKPGDVAAISEHPSIALRTDKGWAFQNGYRCAEWVVTPVRPLVVLDPEDAEQMQRFSAAWDAAETSGPLPTEPMGCGALRMRTALRSLLAAPKPDEPLGLGAVVEDADGERWVRATEQDDGTSDDWLRIGLLPTGGAWTFYSTIDAVRVLAPGVTA